MREEIKDTGIIRVITQHPETSEELKEMLEKANSTSLPTHEGWLDSLNEQLSQRVLLSQTDDAMNALGDDAMNALGDDAMNALGDDAMNALGDDAMNALGDDTMNALGKVEYIREHLKTNSLREIIYPLYQLGQLIERINHVRPMEPRIKKQNEPLEKRRAKRSAEKVEWSRIVVREFKEIYASNPKKTKKWVFNQIRNRYPDKVKNSDFGTSDKQFQRYIDGA